jgi:hypothetical protein
MKWFRFYDEALNDPKVQRLPDRAFKVWINLLCLANQGKPRGRIPRDTVGFALRMGDDQAEKMIAYFKQHGLLEEDGDCLVPHAWDVRQFQSDNVYERVQKHRRNVSRNVSKPFHETAPDTDTDTDTEIPPSSPPHGGDDPSQAPGYSVEFNAFSTAYGKTNGPKKPAFQAWQRLSKVDRAAAMAHLPEWVSSEAWRKDNGRFKPYPQKYLNQRIWEGDPSSEASPNGVVFTPEEIAADLARARELSESP